LASSAFTALLTTTASTKRRAYSGGAESAPAENIASLKVTPLAPVTPQIVHEMDLNTPHEVLQTFCDGSYDIAEMDILVVGSVEYLILAVADWELADVTFLHLFLEDAKR